MDLKICGIIDIIIILGAIIMLIVGFKKGFITKILSLASVIIILLFSFFFAPSFTGYLKQWNIIYPNILESMTNNINANLVEKGIEAGSSTTTSVSILLGVPEWIAQFIVNFMGDGIPSETAELVNMIADTVTRWICNVISFFIIAIGIIIIIAIIKGIAAIFRKNKVFKVVDGIFGVILYEAIYIAILSVVFLILYFLYKNNVPGITDFIKVDFQMETDKFRISKWFFENNVLKTIITTLTGW